MLIRKITFAAIAAFACLMLANDLMAQGRGGFDFNSRLQYLRNETIVDELELVDEQMADVEELGTEAREVMRGVFGGMRERFNGIGPEERDELMKEIQEKIKDGMGDVEEKLSSILLPHQLERLDQIVLQQQIQRNGTAGALKNKELMEKLGLTEEEAEKLAAKEEEVKKQLDEKIKELQAKAQDDILAVLPADKQKKIKEMIGNQFEVSRDSWRRGGGGGGRGGAGGRGGDRGGRGGGDRGGRGGRGGGDRERS